MAESDRLHWQLPPGVTRGLWEYIHSHLIADDYDNYFAHKRLFELDGDLLKRLFQPAGIVVDLGCGTGRALIPLARTGLRGVAVDLSNRMLSIVREKAAAEKLSIDCLRANLVQLDCLARNSVDYAMCLFSTLGMVHGIQCRQRVLQHVHRFLKPGGLFVVHAHNYWFNLFDPHGPWWLLRNLWESIWKSNIQRGDKYFHYRGIPNVYLHVFTRGELTRNLRAAGFKIADAIPLSANQAERLKYPSVLQQFRA